MEISESDISTLLSYVKDAKWMLIITSIMFVVFLVLMVFTFKKRSRKSNERFKNEIHDYMQIGQREIHTYSGSISVNYDDVSYSRGNKTTTFHIPIEKKTILAPFMVDVWFKGRNYNAREADNIINDIKYYLIDNKICKSVDVLTDEEYDKLSNQDINQSPTA